MPEFGKYAIFIWASYGVSALVLAGLVFSALRRGRND